MVKQVRVTPPSVPVDDEGAAAADATAAANSAIREETRSEDPRLSRCLSSALTLTPPRPRIGAYPVGEAVAHAVEVVRRNRRPLGHGAVRGGGGHAVAVADDRPLVLRHVVDRELQRDGAEGTEEK